MCYKCIQKQTPNQVIQNKNLNRTAKTEKQGRDLKALKPKEKGAKPSKWGIAYVAVHEAEGRKDEMLFS